MLPFLKFNSILLQIFFITLADATSVTQEHFIPLLLRKNSSSCTAFTTTQYVAFVCHSHIIKPACRQLFKNWFFTRMNLFRVVIELLCSFVSKGVRPLHQPLVFHKKSINVFSA